MKKNCCDCEYTYSDIACIGECKLTQEIIKSDKGKPRLALVPPIAIEAIGTIMTYGLDKYYEGSWKQVEPWRYRDALMRHICEYLREPYGVDYESKLPHLWHVITNAAFLCELEEDKLEVVE